MRALLLYLMFKHPTLFGSVAGASTAVAGAATELAAVAATDPHLAMLIAQAVLPDGTPVEQLLPRA